MAYEVGTIHASRELDDVEHGCDPGTEVSTTYAWPIKADTLDALLDELCQHCLWEKADPNAYELDACDEPGRIDVAGMVDDNWHPADERDIADWKDGRKKLWYCVWTVYVEQVTRTRPTLSEPATA